MASSTKNKLDVSRVVGLVDTLCHLSDHTRRLLRSAVEAGDDYVILSVSMKHEDNFIIPMTREQISTIKTARDKSKSYIMLSFSLSQLKAGRKLDKNALVPTQKQSGTLPTSSDLDSMSLTDLAKLHEAVAEAMARKVLYTYKQTKASVAGTDMQTKKGPLVDAIDYPCNISYNEDLYCQKCKKRTENGDAVMTEESGKNYIRATCTACGCKKTRAINVNKEIDDGRISFI